MTLEAALATLTAAIEANTAALKAGSGASTAKPAATSTAKPAATAKAKPKHTQAETQAALQKTRDEVGKDEAKRIIKDVGGVDKMADIPEANYDAVFDACEAALAAKETPADDM